jgi:hypothetical protein
VFERLQEKSRELIDSFQEKSKAIADSVDSLNKDLNEIRDLFVGIRDIISGVFGFMGRETTILLICTLLFLFVINLIPFFFFDKRIRYYAGIAFGLFLGVFFGYSALAVLKFSAIMLLPVGLEYLLVFLFKSFGRFFSGFFKRTGHLLWETIKLPFQKLFPKKENETNDVQK